MRGAQVLVGKTHESAGMPAYWPWVEVGRSWSEQNSRDFTLLQPTLGDQGRELRRIFPELAQLAPNIEAPEEISDPESAQFRLFDAYTTFVRAMAEHRPLLIVLDDLHWADRPTLMLLQHMARTLARMRVLVVGTYRDTDVVRASALSETLANLNREPGFERIVLRGLERQEVEAYIRATANVNVSPSLIQRIHEETEGIPFFLSEVVNLMAEEGTLSADSSLEVALPDGVKEALGRRLDRLSPEANELLQVASVAGREFRHDTLLALGDHTEDQLFALLEEGLDARVIEEEGQAGRYRFTHALMQETLLDELSTTRKVRLHGRIGDALESRWGDRAAERATRLAEHFVEAATLSDQYAERAFRYARLAAEQAERQAAWGEAARQYEACLTLLAETESDINGDEAGLYFAAGRCHRYAYAHRDAWRRFMRARDLYDEAGNAPAVADVVLESLSVFGGRDRKLILAADALSKLGDDDPHRQGKLLGFLANQGSDSRDEYRPHALEIAERHGFSDVRGWLRVGDMFVLEAEGRYVEAAEEVHTAIAEADAAGDIGLGSTVRMWRFFQLIPLGDVHAARQAAEESIEYARQHHLLFEEENAVGYLAALEFALCRFDTFEELLDRYAGATTFLFGLLRAEWAFMRGDPQNARRLAPAPDYVGGQAPLEAFLWAKHARYQLASGEDEGAAVAFGRMRGRMADIPGARIVGGIPLDSLTLTAAGEALTELAEPEFVRACFDFYVTQTSVAALSRMGDSESLAFGNIALAVREHGAALSAFSDALGWAEANGADIITGRCHLGLAELAEREGSPTDALSHLDAAAQLFQKHGAKLYLDQALQKKLELQGISNADVRSSILVVSSVVEAEKPSLTQQAAPDGTVTLMFSDIVDSTPLNERLGDAAWMALLREHSTIVESEVAEHRGHVVKSMGDGFMVAFPSARDGLRCAIALQRALADRNDSTDQPLEARIGLHTGEAVRDRGDFFGKHVNLAARIGASAAGGEIVVSSLLAQIVEPSGEFVLEAREARAFKGLEGEHVTYGVGWS
jgi:class 3 adenylate cyclase